MKISKKYFEKIVENLPEYFDYFVLKDSVNRILIDMGISYKRRLALEEIVWLVDSYYDIEFYPDSDISERVIYTISASESNGIEDARFGVSTFAVTNLYSPKTITLYYEKTF